METCSETSVRITHKLELVGQEELAGRWVHVIFDNNVLLVAVWYIHILIS